MHDGLERTSEGRRRPRARLVAVIGVIALLSLTALMLLVVLGHYHIGRVERLDGDIATITVAESGETFTAEVVDPDLAVGADVVLYVADGEASIVATSPGRVRFIARLKELL